MKATSFFLLIIIFGCNDSSSGSKNKNEWPRFEDISKQAGLKYTLVEESHFDWDKESGGVAVADINEDTYLDFFVTHGTDGSGKLFINDKKGAFFDFTVVSNIVTSSKARGGLFIDLNNDSLLDLIVIEPVAPYAENSVVVYQNNGDGSFSEVVGAYGISPTGSTFSISAGDFDIDGDLDIAIAQYGWRPTAGVLDSRLWENQEGTFVDITEQLPIPNQVFEDRPDLAENFQYGFTPSFSDINNDGYIDLLFVENYKNSNIYMSENGTSFSLQKKSTFTDEAGMGSSLGDYDNDGDLDWFVSSLWHPDKNYSQFSLGNSGNRLYQNDGKGNFKDVTEAAGVREGYFGWGACFGDFNNDGYLDIFHTNGFGNDATDYGRALLYFTDDPSVLFLNNQDGTFTEIAREVGINHSGQGRGVSCLDFDNDGDLDILIANNGGSPSLYKNTIEPLNNFLKVRLKGLAGNNSGVGAKIWITAEGSKQLREVRLGSNYLSNDPLVMHFGLGRKKNIDKVEVEWNDIGNNKSTLTGVAVNQELVIQHPLFAK